MNQNETEMLNEFLNNIKDNFRKMQSEYESMLRAQEHSKELIKTLEAEKFRLEHELNKHVDSSKITYFTNEALLARDKAMYHLSETESLNISKVNKADTRSQFVQTVLNGINNNII